MDNGQIGMSDGNSGVSRIRKISRISKISISDDYRFPYISDVYNRCFGKDYKSKYSCMRMTFHHVDDEHMAWFPKMSVIEDGVIKTPARSKGWVNYITADGDILIEENINDIRSGRADGDDGLPRYTFGWYADIGYVFLGVYQADQPRCRTGHYEYNRISDYIDLRAYQQD